jgi:protease I
MDNQIYGRTGAILAADGVERVELDEPRKALDAAGARTLNPDRLRMDEAAVSFVRDFAASGKPIGAICHGPWTLIEADVVRGRTLTSWPGPQVKVAQS